MKRIILSLFIIGVCSGGHAITPKQINDILKGLEGIRGAPVNKAAAIAGALGLPLADTTEKIGTLNRILDNFKKSGNIDSSDLKYIMDNSSISSPLPPPVPAKPAVPANPVRTLPVGAVPVLPPTASNPASVLRPVPSANPTVTRTAPPIKPRGTSRVTAANVPPPPPAAPRMGSSVVPPPPPPPAAPHMGSSVVPPPPPPAAPRMGSSVVPPPPPPAAPHMGSSVVPPPPPPPAAPRMGSSVVPPPPPPPAAPRIRSQPASTTTPDRGALLAQIRAGTQLRPAPDPLPTIVPQNPMHQQINEKIRQKFPTMGDSDSESDSDSSWSDEE